MMSIFMIPCHGSNVCPSIKHLPGEPYAEYTGYVSLYHVCWTTYVCIAESYVFDVPPLKGNNKGVCHAF